MIDGRPLPIAGADRGSRHKLRLGNVALCRESRRRRHSLVPNGRAGMLRSKQRCEGATGDERGR